MISCVAITVTTYLLPINVFHFLDHPRITRAPAPQIVTQGDPVTFNCEATGSPLPYIIWKRGDDRIFSDDMRYSIETETDSNGTETTRSSELTLLSAEARDSGDYTCVARVPDVEDTGDIELDPTQRMARLSVLSKQIVLLPIIWEHVLGINLQCPVFCCIVPLSMYMYVHVHVCTCTCTCMYMLYVHVHVCEHPADSIISLP